LEVDTWTLLEAAQRALGATEAHLQPSGLKQMLGIVVLGLAALGALGKARQSFVHRVFSGS
jgi:hypothetical protein